MTDIDLGSHLHLTDIQKDSTEAFQILLLTIFYYYPFVLLHLTQDLIYIICRPSFLNKITLTETIIYYDNQDSVKQIKSTSLNWAIALNTPIFGAKKRTL